MVVHRRALENVLSTATAAAIMSRLRAVLADTPSADSLNARAISGPTSRTLDKRLCAGRHSTRNDRQIPGRGRVRRRPTRMEPPVLDPGSIREFVRGLQVPAYILAFAALVVAATAGATGRLPWSAATIIILAAIGLAAFAIFRVETPLEGRPAATGVRAYESEDAAMAEIIGFIDRTRPTKADLLEFSTWSIDSLLMKLREHRTDFRLLMCHPASAISPHQRDTIEATLRVRVTDFADRLDRVAIRLHRAPASVRGHKIGDGDDELIVLGWYSYFKRLTDPSHFDLTGHRNSVIVARTSTAEGRVLKKFLDRAFDALWNDPETITLQDYLDARSAEAAVARNSRGSARIRRGLDAPEDHADSQPEP
jgi:hypothetical protein